MSRLGRQIRFYGKKRGSRTTTSQAYGSLGMVLFFGCALVAGFSLLALILSTLVIPEWRANHRLVENRCTVLQTRIGEDHSTRLSAYRPEVLIRYEVKGQPYDTWTYDIAWAYTAGREEKQAVLDGFQEGQTYRCWYDPQDPRTAVLVLGYTWFAWLMLLVPITFIAVGGSGLAYQLLSRTTSAEHRADMARRVTQELLDRTVTAPREFPSVPRETDLTNSPGTTLAFRLPMAAAPSWALATLVTASLLWNAMVAVFITLAVRSHLAGQPEWLLTALNVPFLTIGIGLLYCTVRQFLSTNRVGPTLAEVSHHPLRPGGQYDIYLLQSGRLQIKQFQVSLVCQEKATYQQGTNTRTETSDVCQAEIYARDQVHIHRDVPLEISSRLCVPQGGMHSFRSANNEVIWKLVVQGTPDGQEPFRREFLLLVHPPTDSETPR